MVLDTIANIEKVTEKLEKQSEQRYTRSVHATRAATNRHSPYPAKAAASRSVLPITNSSMSITSKDSPAVVTAPNNNNDKHQIDFTTRNPFAPLQVEDVPEMEQDISDPVIKPPRIYVTNIKSYEEMCNALEQILGKDSFTCTTRLRDTVISPHTSDAYRLAVRYLKEKKADFHTYQPKTEKAYRVVIRNLHHTTPENAIKEELEEQGHIVRNIKNVIHPTKKCPLPLFFVDLEPHETNEDIYKLTRLYYTSIAVEEPHKRQDAVQCHRCQQYNHTKAYCNHPPKCVKCAGNHLSEKCGKSKDTPAKCALCGGDHPANYRGCTVHKDLQKLQRPQRNTVGRRSENVSPTTRANAVPYEDHNDPAFADVPPELPEMSQQIPPKPRTNKTYANAARANLREASTSQYETHGNQYYNQNLSPEMTPNFQLINFLQEFRSMISPLITLLTSLVTALLGRFRKPRFSDIPMLIYILLIYY